MKLRTKLLSIPVSLWWTALLALASSGVITVISTNQVSNTTQTAYRWEPSAAAGSTWAHSWAEFPVSNIAAFSSFLGTWNGANWGTPVQLTAPNNQQQGDVNLAWDSARGRFVFTTLDGPGGNVWYGYYDSTGTHWTATPIFSSTSATWDYPSIGVDALGRIIIGAVHFPGPTGYYAAVSSDGVNFSSPVQIGSLPGAQSRVVATNSQFYAFVPTLSSNLPTAVYLYQSADGVNWSGASTLATFAPPLNNTPSGISPTVFYAPLLAASGYTNGLWAMAIQINFGGFNNVYICTSDRGCGVVNGAADDQFLASVSVSGDAGYWISYLTYSTLNTRQLPLITQAIYFPAGAGAIGATTNTGIDPTSWIFRTDRCSGGCYAAGDYNTVASNPYASATTPFVTRTSRQSDLFQSFVQDPQAQANVPNFKPNFIPFPKGADLHVNAVPFPLGEPAATGLAPEKKIGIVVRQNP